MKRKALLKSALAWILALSMAIPNTALTAYAAETGMETYAEQNAQEQEEEEQVGDPAPEENGEKPKLEETGDGQESPEEEPEESDREDSGDGEEEDSEEENEEEVSEEESDEEESGEENADKEELTADDAETTDGAEYFSDIKAEWGAYQLNSLEGVYKQPDGAGDGSNARLIELDEAGNALGSPRDVFSGFMSTVLHGVITYRLNNKIVLRKDTRSIQIKIEQNIIGEEDDSANDTWVTLWTAPIQRPEITDNPVFSLEQEGEPELTEAVARWSVTGYECPEGQSDDFTLKLTPTKVADGSSAREVQMEITLSKDNTSEIVKVKGLEPGTEYSFRAEIFNRDLDGNKVFDQTTEPITIRTKEDTEYDFQQIIPDEVLRGLVADAIGGEVTKDTEKIKKSQLEGITYLSNSRSSYTDTAVQSLQGLEYLKNLDTLTLTCHELTDISNVDWSKLKNLRGLWLKGNNINKPVDLSGATKLQSVILAENKLTQEAIEQIREKLPAGAQATFDNQRVNGVYLLTEPVYYQVASDGSRKTPLFVRIKGLPSDLLDSYPVSLAVEGASVDAVRMETDLYRIGSELAPREEPYTLTATVDGELLEAAFRVEEDRPLVTAAYLGQEWSTASYSVLMTGSGKTVAEAEMVDKKGNCYGIGASVRAESISADMRYTTVGEGSGVNVKDVYEIYQYAGSMAPAGRNLTPAGSYDLKFIYDDDTTQTFANVFQVMADDEAYISQIYNTGGYDNSADQLYFMVEGSNVDFSRLDYHVTYDGEERTVSYVSAKRNGDRYTVKLKKEGWSVQSSSSVTIEITAKDSYDVKIFTGKTTVKIQSGVYYLEWNQTSYALEVAVTQDTQVSSMRIELRNNLSDDYGDEGQEFLTGETNRVQQGFAAVPMRDAEGKTVSVPAQYYRVKIYVNGSSVPIYNNKEYLGSYSSGNGDVNPSWTATPYLTQGTDNVNYIYDSGQNYQEHKGDTFQMKLEDSEGTEIKTLNSKLSAWKSGDSEYVRVIVSSADFCDQEPGRYQLVPCQNENKLASYQVTILPKGRFYLGVVSAHWIDDDTIQIAVSTSNFREGKKLRLEMYDPSGTKVEGLKTKVSSDYKGYVYLDVTGLRRQESYRSYWIKITHADYDEPYNPSNTDSPRYYDEKGERLDILGPLIQPEIKRKRLVGVYCQGWKCPITIEAYLPYDTEVKSSFKVKKASGGKFTIDFTKAFINNLEDKDWLYDVVVTDSTGRSALFSKYALGYSGPTPKLTGLTLSPATMKLVIGTTGKLALGTKPADASIPASVSWTSSDEKIATVDAQGVVTGVTPGKAKITAKGGGFTASCTVTVLDLVKAPTADVAEGEVEKNTVVRLSSETEKTTIYYTVDGSDPTAKSLKYDAKAGVRIRRETTIRAIAVRSGYADSEVASFHYTIPAVTVTFDTDGGTPETAPQTVDKGDYLDPVKINEPEKDGYRFRGWYLEEQELDVNAPVTESVTYTARWEEGIELNAPEANYLDGKELPDGAEITLTVDTPQSKNVKDAEIYYTLDGSTPTKESSRYEGAIILHKESAEDEPVTVKAFAAGKGYKQSGVSTYTYTLLKDAEGTFGEIEAEDIPEVPVPNGIWIAGLEDTYTYTGSAIKPQIRVYHGTKKLTEKKDYTISYSNNVNVPDGQTTKKPMVTIKGKGNYKDSLTVYFQILPKDISDSDVTAEDLYVVAGTKEQKKVPVLKWGKKTLSAKKEKDYSVSYGSGDFKTPGRYTIELTGKGNYTGERKVTETILEGKTEYLMSKVSVTVKDKKVPYTGSPLTPEIVVKNGRNEVSASDYEVTYLNNVEVGKATIRVRGLHDYKGVKEVTFQITGIPMSKVKAEGITNAVYQAGTQEYIQKGYKLSYSYKDAQKKNQTKVLTEGADYTVSYRNNTKAGKAEIWFTGKGAYTGVLKKSYQISPCTKFEPEVLYDTEVSYCKGGARPEVTVKMGEVTLTGGIDYKVKYESNTKVYDASKQNSKKAQIVITGTGNYKGTVRKEFVITRKDISALNMSAQDLVYKKNSKGNYKTKILITDTDGKALKAGTDYMTPVYYLGDEKVEEKATLPAGTEVTVKAEGKGAYTGTIQTTFRIAAKSFGGVTGKIAEQTYTGEEVTLTKDKITLTIGKGKNAETLTEDDFEIVGYKNNIKKGTATVILKGKGSYAGTKNVTFKIGAKEFPRLIIR